jgi:hypothetical protein
MTDADVAIAAVRKWLAERERAERMTVRYRSHHPSRRPAEARQREVNACLRAILALDKLPEQSVEIEGFRYQKSATAEGWGIQVFAMAEPTQ